MADIAELKTLIEGIQAALKNTVTNEKIEELIRKIDEKDTKIALLEKRVEMLEGRVAIVETVNCLLERKCDDLESYNRRQNLRIVGIAEPEGDENGDECLRKVKEEIAKMENVHLDLDDVLDRAHRVGPKRDRQGNRVQRVMIVRFISWRACTHVYPNRKTSKGDAKFYTDLTKRRFDLKKKAQEKINGNQKVKFSYSDINNNICIMLENGSKKSFNSEAELDTILASI